MFKCYLIAVSSYVIRAESWSMYRETFFHISCAHSHQYTHINTLAQSNVQLVTDSHNPYTHIHACTNALTHRHILMRKSTYVSVWSRSTFYQLFEVFVACGGCNCGCVQTTPWMLIDIRLPRCTNELSRLGITLVRLDPFFLFVEPEGVRQWEKWFRIWCSLSLACSSIIRKWQSC